MYSTLAYTKKCGKISVDNWLLFSAECINALSVIRLLVSKLYWFFLVLKIRSLFGIQIFHFKLFHSFPVKCYYMSYYVSLENK